MARSAGAGERALIVLAVLAVTAALHLLKPILIPVALALVLACVLAPATASIRRVLPLGATGAAVTLFVLLAVMGLYLATLTAQGLVEATYTLPADAERLSGQLSRRVAELSRDMPAIKGVLPDPDTIDILGDRNRTFLIGQLSDRLGDLSGWVVQGLIVLILVLFLLIESEMLAPKVVRFFAAAPGDALAAERALKTLVRQIRAYLVARTAINAGLGLVLGLALWSMKVKFAWALGAIAAVTNFVPYVGQFVGGALPVLVALGQGQSLGDALIVTAIYVGLLGLEGYVVTPWVLGRSLDLNGTTILLACLFWGFLWGLVGLVLAMPFAVCMKLVFQQVPALHRWADLMSCSWQPPATSKTEDSAPAELEPGVVPLARPDDLPARRGASS